MPYESLKDHFSNKLKRLVFKGDVVDIDKEEAERNVTLYKAYEEEAKTEAPRRGNPSKESLLKIIEEKKLASPEEIPQLSYKQLRDIVEKEAE